METISVHTILINNNQPKNKVHL